jgi:hypothetical protein
MNVRLIPEDDKMDGFILKPLFDARFDLLKNVRTDFAQPFAHK